MRPGPGPRAYKLYKLVSAGLYVRLGIDAAKLMGAISLLPSSGYHLFLGGGILREESPSHQGRVSLHGTHQIQNAAQPPPKCWTPWPITARFSSSAAPGSDGHIASQAQA